MHNKYKGMPEDTSELALTYNNRAAKKLLESIVKTQEGKGDLEEVIQDFATVSKRLNSVNNQDIIDTKDVPLFVALSDNPKVASEGLFCIFLSPGLGMTQKLPQKAYLELFEPRPGNGSKVVSEGRF